MHVTHFSGTDGVFSQRPADRARRRRYRRRMDGAHHEDEHHPLRRWIADAFGAVDPFALMEEQRQGRGWQPTAGRDGRSVAEEKVFIILQVALENHRLSKDDLDTLARAAVRAVRSSSTDMGAAAVEGLLQRWHLPPDRLAHVVRVVTRVATEA